MALFKGKKISELSPLVTDAGTLLAGQKGVTTGSVTVQSIIDLVGDTGGGGGGGSPGGSTTQVQFNDAGAFAGTANLTWTEGGGTEAQGVLRVSEVGAVDGQYSLALSAGIASDSDARTPPVIYIVNGTSSLGGAIYAQAGDAGSTAGDAGYVSFNAGRSTVGNGGGVFLQAGDSFSGEGGYINIIGGSTNDANNVEAAGGLIQLSAGSAPANPGSIILQAGGATGETGVGAPASLKGGPSNLFNGGPVQVIGGYSQTAGIGGKASLTGGGSVSGQGGLAVVQGGEAGFGATAGGDVYILGGQTFSNTDRGNICFGTSEQGVPLVEWARFNSTGEYLSLRRNVDHVQHIAYAVNITIDAATGDEFHIGDLTGDVAIAVTNPVEGQLLRIRYKQDSTGGHALTFASPTLDPSISLVTDADAFGWLSLRYVSSESRYDSATTAASGGGGATAWGGITGTLSSQTDLQAALNAKITAIGSASKIYGTTDIATQTQLLYSYLANSDSIPFRNSDARLASRDNLSSVVSSSIALATDANALQLVDATAAAVTVTLPDPSTVAGYRFTVKRTDASPYEVALTTASGSIDGESTRYLLGQWNFITAHAASGNWYIVAKDTVHDPIVLIRDDFNGTAGTDFVGRVPNISLNGQAYWSLSDGSNAKLLVDGSGSAYTSLGPQEAAYGFLNYDNASALRFEMVMRNADGASELARNFDAIFSVELESTSVGGRGATFGIDTAGWLNMYSSDVGDGSVEYTQPLGAGGEPVKFTFEWGFGHQKFFINGILVSDLVITALGNPLGAGQVYIEFEPGNKIDYIQLLRLD